jgi:hypothetical protein
LAGGGRRGGSRCWRRIGVVARGGAAGAGPVRPRSGGRPLRRRLGRRRAWLGMAWSRRRRIWFLCLVWRRAAAPALLSSSPLLGGACAAGSGRRRAPTALRLARRPWRCSALGGEAVAVVLRLRDGPAVGPLCAARAVGPGSGAWPGTFRPAAGLVGCGARGQIRPDPAWSAGFPSACAPRVCSLRGACLVPGAPGDLARVCLR